jgi:hypothetical protein
MEAVIPVRLGEVRAMSRSETSNLAGLLVEACHGDATAMNKLPTVVWDELHRLAEPFMNRGTFPSADLVDDVWQRLAVDDDIRPECHHCFQFIAARAMRWILTDQAPGDASTHAAPDNPPAARLGLDMMALDAALIGLAQFDAPAAKVVELRYFAGLSMEEAAAALCMDLEDASEAWCAGRTWLRQQLRQREADRQRVSAA